MESLALLATLIVLPAMLGGPLVLLLSFWRINQISTFRRIIILLIGGLSCLLGLFLISRGISRGATLIGLSGLVTGALSIWRITRADAGRQPQSR